MSEARLLIHVAAPPTRLMGRLKGLMEARGWRLLRGVDEAPLDGFSLTVTALGRRAGLIEPEPIEAVPDELGRVLSQSLRARTVTYAEAPPIVAYEACEGGRVAAKLVAHGGEILEELASRLAGRVAAGEELAALLAAEGIAGLGEVPGDARRVTLYFGPKARRVGAAAEIEVDPVITCPRCDAPMARRSGRHGEFWACARFPTCRGTRTLAAVERLRATKRVC